MNEMYYNTSRKKRIKTPFNYFGAKKIIKLNFFIFV